MVFTSFLCSPAKSGNDQLFQRMSRNGFLPCSNVLHPVRQPVDVLFDFVGNRRGRIAPARRIVSAGNLAAFLEYLAKQFAIRPFNDRCAFEPFRVDVVSMTHDDSAEEEFFDCLFYCGAKPIVDSGGGSFVR